MAKNIYVGNLSPKTTSDDVRKLFEPYGEVLSAEVLTDRYTGESRGFGFVSISDSGAQAAIAELNGKTVDGRDIKVNEARPRESSGRPPRGGGGGRGPGGGHGYGGGGKRGGGGRRSY